jgi:hypothetical protein
MLAMPRCRAVATTDECMGSITHGPAGGSSTASATWASTTSPSEPDPSEAICAIRATGVYPAAVTTAV